MERHAKATRVTVQLDIDPECLRVTIEDNGVGFDMDTVLRDPENGTTSEFEESWSEPGSWAVKARSSPRKGVARRSSSTFPW